MDDGIERPFLVTVGFKGGTTTSFRCSSFRVRSNNNKLDSYTVENADPQVIHMNLGEIAWVTSLEVENKEN